MAKLGSRDFGRADDGLRIRTKARRGSLKACLGFAITLCMIGGMFTPSYAYAAENETVQQNGEPVSGVTVQTGAENDLSNADNANGSNAVNGNASEGNGEADANGGQSGDADGKSDGASGETDNAADNANGDSTDANNGAADDQNGDASTQDSNNANASNDAKIRLVPRITTKAQAHAQANAVNGEVILPPSWDDDMSRIFHDRVLRILVDQEVKKEFMGEDLSENTTKDILSWVTGDDDSGKWNLFNMYDAWKKERQAAGTFNEKEDRIKLLNGIQYLDSLIEIYASSVDSRSEGIGLQTLAFPGISTDAYVPDLDLGYNNLHIFPNLIFPHPYGEPSNLPHTYRKSITVTQDMYHHAGSPTCVMARAASRWNSLAASINCAAMRMIRFP